MKSAGWIALCLVVAVSVGGWAQCDCGEPQAPLCYTTFQSNQTIAFKLIAPVDYFVCHNTNVSPGIWGWRVETLDGTVVRTVTYPDGPKSRLLVMEWDLYDAAGFLVNPGYYNIVVMSTDGDVSYPVRIHDRCHAFCSCACWCGPVVCDVPCPIPYGELYLSLAVGRTRLCGALVISLEFQIECCSPSP